ncbi:unnamed protein product [Amaranthus hypochondriacus]
MARGRGRPKKKVTPPRMSSASSAGKHSSSSSLVSFDNRPSSSPVPHLISPIPKSSARCPPFAVPNVEVVRVSGPSLGPSGSGSGRVSGLQGPTQLNLARVSSSGLHNTAPLTSVMVQPRDNSPPVSSLKIDFSDVAGELGHSVEECRDSVQQRWVPKTTQNQSTVEEEDIVDDGFQLVGGKHKGKSPDESASVVLLDTSNGFEILTENVEDCVDDGEVWWLPVSGVMGFQIQEKLKRLKHFFKEQYQRTPQQMALAEAEKNFAMAQDNVDRHPGDDIFVNTEHLMA